MREHPPFRRWSIASGLGRIPTEDRRAFVDEAVYTRFARSRVLSAFLLGVGAVLVLVVDVLDLFRLDRGALGPSPAIHAALLAVALVHTTLATVFMPRSASGVTRFHGTLAASAGLVSLLLCDAVFLQSLTSSGSTGAYVLGVFCFAMAYSLPGLPGLLLPLGNGILFLGAAWDRVPEDRFGAHAAVVLIASVAAWLLSRVELDSRVRGFLSARTAERQEAELRELGVRLSVRSQDLAKLDRERTEFLGLAVHNLQNPLSSILGYTEILLEKVSTDESDREDILRRILAATRRMTDLIRNVLDLNAISSGEVPCVPCEVDLHALAARAVEGHAETARKKDQTIRLVGPPPPVPVFTDPAMALRILEDLLSNAVKFSPLGGEILVEVSLLDRSALCRVRDQGPGLTDEDRRRLFGQFARLSARPTAGESSTGLGLSIVQRLAGALSARVTCESGPPPGASFVFELPRPGHALPPGQP